MTVLDPATVAGWKAALPALPTQADEVPSPTHAWADANPGARVQHKRLTELLNEAFNDPQPETTLGLSLACVVVQGGEIIAERYGPGCDRHTALTSWSMAKSVTQAAFGMLVGDGLLELDAPVLAPEWRTPDDPRRSITARQLLHMSSGLDFNEDYVDGDTSHCLEMLFGDGQANMAAYAASQQLVHPPGSTFNYSSGSTNMVARIIGEAVGGGERYVGWLRERVFTPLGMTSADPRLDDSGTFVGSSYLYATARDFARFGLLYLRDGVWNEQRLLPEGWVDFARTPAAVDEEGSYYGAHWWVPYPERGIFAAQGYEGQRILVLPDADAVVARLGKTVAELAPNLRRWQDQVVACLRA